MCFDGWACPLVCLRDRERKPPQGAAAPSAWDPEGDVKSRTHVQVHSGARDVPDADLSPPPPWGSDPGAEGLSSHQAHQWHGTPTSRRKAVTVGR